MKHLQMFVKTAEGYQGGELLRAEVFRDSEWDEYVVRFYREGIYQKDADYHTDDKADAMGTAATFCEF